MRTWKKILPKKANENGRIKFLMLAVFVLGFLTIFQLFRLQVGQFAFFYDTALRQQEVKTKLQAQRGRIFIEDFKTPGGAGEFFPLATNKQFANVFAKPKDITDPQATAEAIYTIYNEPRVIADVERRLAEDPALASSSPEFKKFKREVDIKARKEKIIADYVVLFSKKDDPYEPLIKKVDEELLKKITDLNLTGIDYNFEMDRFYPEGNTGAHLMGFVGYVGDQKRGRYGLEGYFDTILAGKSGSVKADRDARGGLIIMNDKDYQRAEDGSDIFLTINRSIQFEACRKLAESVKRHGADGGSVIIQDPKTGAIIAMCSYPDYDPNNYQDAGGSKVYRNPAIYDQFEPGSTFKAITMVSALNEGVVTPETTFTDKSFVMVEGWPKPIRNSDFDTFGAHGVTNMTSVLENSLNTGAIWTMEQMGAQKFAEYVRNFGFGVNSGIELDSENSGNIYNINVKKIKPISAATAAFGQGITATPLQMINAYSAIANGGQLMKPYVVKSVVDSKGNKQETKPQVVRQVITERAASLVTGMLVSVVENGHAKSAQVPGFYIAGKTGTAQVSSGQGGGYSSKYIHSFIGYPSNNPKFVILTKIDNPRSAKFAESTAVPLFGEIAPFVIDYFEMNQERDIAEQLKKKNK